jgi:hypothetical protein
MPAIPGRANPAFTLEGGMQLVMKRAGRPDVELASGGSMHAVALDGKGVAVLTGYEKAGERLVGKVFDGEGKQVGAFRCDRDVVALELAGPRVLLLKQSRAGFKGGEARHPQALEAIDWKTGKPAWSRKAETITVLGAAK